MTTRLSCSANETLFPTLSSAFSPCNGLPCVADACACDGSGWTSFGDFSLDAKDTCAVSVDAVRALFSVAAIVFFVTSAWGAHLLIDKMRQKSARSAMRAWTKGKLDVMAVIVVGLLCNGLFFVGAVMRAANPTTRGFGVEPAVTVFFSLGFVFFGVTVLAFFVVIVELSSNDLFRGDRTVHRRTSDKFIHWIVIPGVAVVSTVASLAPLFVVTDPTPASVSTAATIYYALRGVFALSLGFVIAPYLFLRLAADIARVESSSKMINADLPSLRLFQLKLKGMAGIAVQFGGGQAAFMWAVAALPNLQRVASYVLGVQLILDGLIMLGAVATMANHRKGFKDGLASPGGAQRGSALVSVSGEKAKSLAPWSSASPNRSSKWNDANNRPNSVVESGQDKTATSFRSQESARPRPVTTA